MRNELKSAIKAVKYVKSSYNSVMKGKDNDLVNDLEKALTELRNVAKMEEDTETLADSIGNCYIPHLNRTENDFEQGYNSAIRDVLDILIKNRKV